MGAMKMIDALMESPQLVVCWMEDMLDKEI
jgi:hypothetical protein